jgi:catechol 2,3-dioxygenase-like lactoylglutathione lyase family enzyme
MSDSETGRPRLVGINHVALEVGDVEEALAFYGDVFASELRGRSESAAFLDAGDQFIALSADDDAGETVDDHRHVGLVVDDRDAVADRLDELGVDRIGTGGLEFRDPWGNRVQVVAYEDVQFTKADHVLDGMRLQELGKSESALAELSEKGMAPD